jgi:hypothetical protein
VMPGSPFDEILSPGRDVDDVDGEVARREGRREPAPAAAARSLFRSLSETSIAERADRVCHRERVVRKA